MAAPTNHFTPVLIIGVLLWSVYRRIRRNFGRQPLRPVREGILVTVFGALALVMTFAALLQEVLPAYLCGALAGAVLGAIGLRLAKIETTPTGNFYIPNKFLGTGVTLLVTLRIAYQLYLRSATPEAAITPAQNALTTGLFGVLAFYYIVFFTGLLLRCRKLPGPAAPSSAAPQNPPSFSP